MGLDPTTPLSAGGESCAAAGVHFQMIFAPVLEMLAFLWMSWYQYCVWDSWILGELGDSNLATTLLVYVALLIAPNSLQM